MKDKVKEKCLYCKYVDMNEEYLKSDIFDDSVEAYLVCKKQINKRVEDNWYCQMFKFDKKVYDEINC